MTKASVLYIGNCQAQALQSLSGHLCLDVEVFPVPAVWTLTQADEGDLRKAIDRADFVFCQRLASDFPVALLRPANLRQQAPNKTIIWPNIYFDGYYPGIGYIYDANGKVEGPLRDYHFHWLHAGWKRGESASEVARIATEAEVWRGAPDVVELSLGQLRDREKDVDVKISDFIANRFRSVKLFYSMNHPIDALLAEMLRRLFERAGLRFSDRGLESYPYTLDQVEMPTLAIFRSRYKPSFEDESVVKGASVDPASGKPLQERIYPNFLELTEEFYRQYDRVFGVPER